jgi:flagellar hook-associated protein 3 FlgL
MAFRVTTTTRLAQAQVNIQHSKALLDAADQKATTQHRITVPSDDPSGTANLLDIQRQLAQDAQYVRNANDGTAWLSSVDSTLTSVSGQLTQLRDLTVQAGSGTNSAASMTAIGAQMQSIKDHLVDLAETKYLGRTIFAGGTNGPSAFTIDTTTTPPTYTYTGGSPAPAVLRRVSPDSTVRVDADGGQVFGTDAAGGQSMFQMIDQITAQITDPATAGASVSGFLSQIDGFIATIQGIHSTVGANMQRIQQNSAGLQTDMTTLTGLESSIRDIDPAQAILQVQTMQTAYQVALSVTAQSIQPTLMDYLR